MVSLHKNEAWDLVELLAGRKPIGSKWVFKKKTYEEGKVEKYKAQLVAKGYSQVRGSSSGDGRGNEVSPNQRSWVRYLCYPPRKWGE